MAMMATRTTYWGLTGKDRLVAKLVRTLATIGRRETGRHGSRAYAIWCESGKIRTALGCKAVPLTRAIVEAESGGLIEVEVRDSGTWVKLTKFAGSVFGLEDQFVENCIQIADDTSEPESIVRGLAGLPTACPLAETLADRLGLDVEDVWSGLQDAESDGLVELWPDHPAGPSATLSALSAGRLGLRLVSDGSRWIGIHSFDPTEVEPPPKIATETDVSPDDGPGRFDSIADPGALGGLDAMLIEEEAGRDAAHYRRAIETPPSPPTKLTRAERAMSPIERLNSIADRSTLDEETCHIPLPRILLGLGLAWPVLIVMGEVCPGCHGRPLGPSSVCLLCHASGVDYLLEAPDEPDDHPEPSKPPCGARR